MPAKARARKEPKLPRWYPGESIPVRLIRRFAREVAEQFDPEKIILFGSYAYGSPHRDSDVDILVIMPCRNEIDQAVKIRRKIDASFPMDLLVRKPRDVEWQLRECASFMTEIVTKGKVLYEKNYGPVGAKSGSPLPGRQKTPSKSPART
ncbi:MAG TPA: nucleotidyltransferase domain-containing protein [Gemmataceae bacterium]|jgi:predicted nucleotidyltransferase|nr:nucleotidyltransferase domain-containing protein [Gemmataceae bacterium]